MAIFTDNQGINVRIPNNHALAEILKDIMKRGDAEGEKGKSALSGGNQNYQDAYKTVVASLETVIALLEAADKKHHSQNKQQQNIQQQNQERQTNQNNNQQQKSNKPAFTILPKRQ